MPKEKTPTVEEVEAALQRTCPACHAKPGRRCTQPTDTGRKAVDWLHLSRVYPR